LAKTPHPSRTLKELIALTPRYRGVAKYTSYRVTVRLGKSTRTYRALALHRGSAAWPDTSLTEVLDSVTPLVTEVLREQSPAIRSPWDTYFNSPAYQTMVRALRGRSTRSKVAGAAETPLGFVTGDDSVQAPPQDDCPECQICVEGECVDDQFADGTNCDNNQCKECQGGACINRKLCTACTPSGQACDGSGTCKMGKDLIPDICGQLHVTYANERPVACPGTSCGAGIRFDATNVTHSCDSIDLAGASVTESVSNDHGCFTVDVTGGAGCTINPGNTLSGCTDTYAGCGPPSIFPIGTCTETITQLIYVGSCLAETHTISITITRTADSCSGTVVRN